MDNKTIARALRLLSQLMELHKENSFKIKSLAAAAYTIDKLPYQLASKSLPEIEKINAIGKSTASKVWELIQTQTLGELESLLGITPPGVLEIMNIKGLGPKKVLIIWKDLEIESIGELLYACNENRLIEAKGFGLKTQEEIKKSIEFKIASHGRFLYAHVEPFASFILSRLQELFPGTQIAFTGAYRRRCEIIDSLDLLVGLSPDDSIIEKIQSIQELSFGELQENNISAESTSGLKTNFRFCTNEHFITHLVLQTGNVAHVEELTKRLPELPQVLTEPELYRKAGLPFIEPELREGRTEFVLATSGRLPQLLEYTDLKGSLHNHSTWSDGVNTLEQMALYCRDQLKLEYLGICDHSKSAFYAKGLSEERVLAQHQEIDQLNKVLGPFRILKGIESDILPDGSLDYPSGILASFDFIVASIHSVFRMSEEKATARLIKAIENPYTTILGHPSGRLLLSRNGYPVDFEKVIDACAANGVVVEINSNPLRLDMDWRWHQYALDKGVMFSVNPDAHSIKGLHDTRYGVNAARKGGVSAKDCLNALNLADVSNHFNNRKLKHHNL